MGEYNKPVEIKLRRLYSPYKKKTYWDGVCVPLHFPKIRQSIRTFSTRPDDTWVFSVPRSGTRWVQEAVWCIANNADVEGAKNKPLNERFPFLEKCAFKGELRQDARVPAYYHSVKFVREHPSPRFIKSYLPAGLLPLELMQYKDRKFVYVARNPRDTCISYYHHVKEVDATLGDLVDFSQQFMEGTLQFLPYWDHVLPFWELRDDPGILFITYEEMKKDLKSAILKIAKFLDKELNEGQVEQLIEHLSYENMMESEILDVEDDLTWKDEMSWPLVKRFEKWERKNLKRYINYPLMYE